MEQVHVYLLERGRRVATNDFSILAYVPVLAGFTLFLVFGIMVAVVPKFEDIFKDFGTRLPSFTILLIRASKFTLDIWPVLVLAALAIALYVYWSVRPRRVGKLAFTSRVADWVRWHTPGWSRIEMARGMRAILQAIRLGVASGMNLQPAARLAEIVDVNDCLRPRLRQFADLLGGGMSTTEAARRAGLGEVTAAALSGGQRAGDIDAGLRYAADYYGALVSRTWIVLRNMAWPVCTIVMGIIVAVVVLALFLPLVALINSVSG
jgi:type II secretory pathway component PulF